MSQGFSKLIRNFGRVPTILYRAMVGGYRYYQQSNRSAADGLGSCGDYVRIRSSATIAFPKGCHLGTGVGIGERVQILAVGGIRIGDYAMIAEDVRIFTSEHRHNGAEQLPFDGIRLVKPVEIGDYAWIGARALINAGVTIGEGAIVAMGSVVTADVPPLSIVAGNPATVVGRRSEAKFEELKAEAKGRRADQVCQVFWVPPFSRRKHEELIRSAGFDLDDGGQYFSFDKKTGKLKKISKEEAQKLASQ